MVCIQWLHIILNLSGDIHPNPGPSSTNSSTASLSTTSSMSLDLVSLMSSTSCLSVLQYNVQSLLGKIEILTTEFSMFDVLAFSETWLNPSVSNSDISIPCFHSPERNDRIGDSHGGVSVYIKNSLFYKRRWDLEPRNIECVWVEILLSQSKRILFGTFYRPPNADAHYTTLIEHSLNLAEETNITDIIVTGDFNFNPSNPTLSRKLLSICQQFHLEQLINEPTHFTESSASVLDLFLVSCSHRVITSGVGESVLDQNIRFHCPIFALFSFSKPKSGSFKRFIWLYDRGNYHALKQSIMQTDWDQYTNTDIDEHATLVSNKILELSKQYIPTRTIIVKPTDAVWITTQIKQLIRKRKKLYHRAKQTQNPLHWHSFKKLRNKVISLIHTAKRNHIQKLADSLTSDNTSQRDWWRLIKSFISPTEKQTIPALSHPVTQTLSYDNKSKSDLLNNYFSNQSSLENCNKEVPGDFLNNL
ncbi:uncharacterized protein LOC132729753 [Ruditapes philippinarum]|uniref:uncharacterized protein LOC132729753 n=1 Tax=Ruditapes philippinarum TaxID=129788 RepID=UPI00295B3642|nr:uncharacterized protein LOC132729753 [Ruditapes philippinarum]